MKKLYIFKVGSTFAGTAEQLGDFEQWTSLGLGPLDIPVAVLDLEQGAELPQITECAGVVITGSHAMVTDNLPWSVQLEGWIPGLLEARVPLLGICYGHQLLARAAGGEVGYHPQGKEIGTVTIELLPAAAQDPLFRAFPSRFSGHTTHSQTVLQLPPGATRLARNSHEANHAFVLNGCAWGVQFHPEYSAEIMRAYICQQSTDLAATGCDPVPLLAAVTDTPIAAGMLRNFAGMVATRA
jgi:GMP synthase (glutamine-hydrolysing)